MNAKPQMLFGQTEDGKPYPIAPLRPIVLRYKVEQPNGTTILTLEEMAKRCQCRPESLRKLWLRQFANTLPIIESGEKGATT